MVCLEDVEASGFGTGFVVDSKGLVATNAHVVSSCPKVIVRTDTSPTPLPAMVVRINVERDIALLRVPALTSPAVTLGSTRDIAPGTPILAVGHPHGFAYTVSDGIVSAIRDLDSNRKLIQITAPISPGSSGGPVADRTGRVIGMSTMYAEQGQNLNFAVAGEDIAQILRDEIRHPSPPLPATANTPRLHTTDTEIAVADRARQARKAKRYEDAAKILSGSLEKYPESVRLRVEFAETFWGQKNFAVSEKYILEIIDRDPNHPAGRQMCPLYTPGMVGGKMRNLRQIKL